jgi:hypothetical protein
VCVCVQLNSDQLGQSKRDIKRKVKLSVLIFTVDLSVFMFTVELSVLIFTVDLSVFMFTVELSVLIISVKAKGQRVKRQGSVD